MMKNWSRLSIVFGTLLAAYTYGTFLLNYLPGSGDPGLFGYAPNFILASVVGVMFAAGTAGRIGDKGQAVRLMWYLGWALAANGPLFVVLLIRGDPVWRWIQYPLVIGGLVGIGAEISSWSD